MKKNKTKTIVVLLGSNVEVMKNTSTIISQLNQSLFEYATATTNLNSQVVQEPALLYGSFFQYKVLLSQTIRQGLPHNLFALIKQLTPFSDADWANYLDVSVKTLQRNREEKDFVFKSIHSEKILELAEVAQLGLNFFDTPEQFYAWLQLPSIVLGNYTPASLLKDSYGKELVIAELTRLEHGVFA